MIKIKEMVTPDYSILEEFSYWAIFTPPGHDLPERNVIFHPTLYIYVENFGDKKGDCGVIAEADGRAVGAAWVRIIPAFGHIDDETPELAISVLPEYRNQGIGAMMMNKLFELLFKKGYRQTSLAVQKENPAVNFYLRLGYEKIGEKPEEYLMLKKLIAKE